LINTDHSGGHAANTVHTIDVTRSAAVVQKADRTDGGTIGYVKTRLFKDIFKK